jgi:hypothetical protein
MNKEDILRAVAAMPADDRDETLHALHRAHPTHCFTRDCLRGSSAGDRFTAIKRLDTFDATGCECSCAACDTAGPRYSAAEPIK